MEIKNFTTSIILSNDGDKKLLNIKNSNNDNMKKRSVIEIENEMEVVLVKNFLNSSIRTIKYIKTYIGDNKYKECIELKNTGDSNLIIISDDLNKYFYNLVNYINENRTKIYEKYLFDCICKYNFKEIVFGLSNNNKHSEIVVENDKLIYYLPYEINDKKNKVIDSRDLQLIQQTIYNYFGISNCKLKSTYDDGMLGYLTKFIMYTDKANITIDNSEIYYGLELYFNMIKKDLEKQFLEERTEDLKKSEFNKHKSKFKILRKKDEE